MSSCHQVSIMTLGSHVIKTIKLMGLLYKHSVFVVRNPLRINIFLRINFFLRIIFFLQINFFLQIFFWGKFFLFCKFFFFCDLFFFGEFIFFWEIFFSPFVKMAEVSKTHLLGVLVTTGYTPWMLSSEVH